MRHDNHLETPPEHPDDCGCRECLALEASESRSPCRYCGMPQPGPHNGACSVLDPPDPCDYVGTRMPKRPLADEPCAPLRLSLSGRMRIVELCRTCGHSPCECATEDPDPMGTWHGRNE